MTFRGGGLQQPHRSRIGAGPRGEAPCRRSPWTRSPRPGSSAPAAAGFPTHVKLNARADSVLINAAECEPLLHKDKELLHEHADGVLDGLQTAMRLVGASRGFVGVKEKYHDVIDAVRARVPRGIEVTPLSDSYPAGDEFILVYDVLGRVIPPGGLPLHVGAVVMNVETALNVARARLRSPRST